jgi:hypothetical protein
MLDLQKIKFLLLVRTNVDLKKKVSGVLYSVVSEVCSGFVLKDTLLTK